MKILTTLFFMLLCIPVFAQERTETVTTQLQCGDKEFAVKQVTDLNLQMVLIGYGEHSIFSFWASPNAQGLYIMLITFRDNPDKFCLGSCGFEFSMFGKDFKFVPKN